MRELIASVTAKGQVTIPSEIRKHLKLDSPDKVAFIIDDAGTVQVRSVDVEWDDLFGSVAPLLGRETVDFDDQIAEAFEAEAERIVRDLEGR